MNLQGQTAIVTGGAIRLGRAIALSLAGAGMKICLHYGTSQDEAQSTRDEILKSGGEADIVAADFHVPIPAAKQVCEFATNRFGSVDVLVNSAAIFEPGTLASIDEAHWDRHFNINLKAPFFLSQAFAKQAASSVDSPTSRAIINIVDWRGTMPVAGHLAYTITKAALVAQTRLLAQELGPSIRVNAVAPGAILAASGSEPASFQQRGEFNPLLRTGHPQDVCEAVLFLLRADFITGEVLHVSGGEQLAPGHNYSAQPE